MFVCNCHGIRESDIDRAAAQGCRNPRDVFAYCADAEPCCGKCVPEIRRQLAQAACRFAVAAE